MPRVFADGTALALANLMKLSQETELVAFLRELPAGERAELLDWLLRSIAIILDEERALKRPFVLLSPSLFERFPLTEN